MAFSLTPFCLLIKDYTFMTSVYHHLTYYIFYIFICLLLDVGYKLIRGGALFDLFAAICLALKKASDAKYAVKIC